MGEGRTGCYLFSDEDSEARGDSLNSPRGGIA